MEQQVNYYDTLNITDIDLQYNIPFDDVVSMKEATYYVEAGIYYFITLLYSLAFTADDDMKPSRKILIPLIIIFALYEALMHTHPEVMTIIDVFSNKIPIFMQKTILKTILSTVIAIIRTKYLRRMTPEKKALAALEKPHSPEEYKEIFSNLNHIYKQKLERKKKEENSLGTKIRGWISKGFTILFIFSIARSFFNSSTAKS